MQEIKLYTRGDDAGISIGTNLAIHTACKNGILKNISLIPVSPYIKDAYNLFSNLENVSFGLHITLTCEWRNIKWGPILKEKVKTITDKNGYFFPDGKTLFENKPERKEMEIEIEAQFEYLESLGFEISYIDIHMGIGWINGIEEFIQRLCKKKRILFVDKLYKKFPDFNLDYEKFINNLENLENGEYLLITHPAFNTEDMKFYSTYWEDADKIIEKRSFDAKILIDERVKNIITKKNIKIERFKNGGGK
ncbi:MAG TPA: ChbG/HpnK family deacetylase [bacterium]|nr:ChbG/HpnK family deacetylase [bacterium]